MQAISHRHPEGVPPEQASPEIVHRLEVQLLGDLGDAVDHVRLVRGHSNGRRDAAAVAAGRLSNLKRGRLPPGHMFFFGIAPCNKVPMSLSQKGSRLPLICLRLLRRYHHIDGKEPPYKRGGTLPSRQPPYR